MARLRDSVIMGAITLSTIVVTPTFKQFNFPNSHKTVNVEIDSKHSLRENVLNTTFTIDKTSEIKDFIENYIGLQTQVEIKRYSDTPNYYYAEVYNSENSIDENFRNVETLNTEAVRQNLNYVFVVGG